MSTEAMKLQEIMSQAQVFASAWSLVGGRFDGGNAMDEAEVAKNELHQMVAEALAQPQQGPDLAESFRAELDKLSQRNYELRMENAQLRAQPQQEPVANKWRNLALQFDAHRMSALAHLRMMVQDPSKHMEVAREFLAAAPQPAPVQQEPFGYFKAEPFGWTDCAATDEGAVALYEHPPAQRKPLTDEEIRAIVRKVDEEEGHIIHFAQAIEAAHGIKENT